MRALFWLGSCAAAVSIAVPAVAAPPTWSPAAAVVDPERLAAADRLLVAMHYDSLVDRTMESVIVQIQNDMPAKLNASMDEPLPTDIVTKLQRMVGVHIRAAFTEHRAEMKRGTELIYCKHFTAYELDRLAQMQSDPVMIKMQSEMPQIATESMKLGQAVVANEIPKLQDEAKALILEYVSGVKEKPAT